MLVLLFLTMAMPNTTTPLHLLPNTQIFTCIPTLSGSILLAGPPSTFIIAVRMVGPPRYSGLHHDNVENNAQEMVSHLVVLYRSPCSTSLSPPSYHCPLLPITVPSSQSLSPPTCHCSLLPITVPFSPSLSPPSYHCPLLPTTVPSFPSLSPPPHNCPFLPVTVPSSPSLSPPSHHCLLLPILLSPPPHHCPLFPITVPLLSITSCYHGRLFFSLLLSRYSLLPPIWSVKKNSS